MALSSRTNAFAVVRTTASVLPEVEAGSVYGSPALKTRGRMFACMAIHPSAEPDSLAVRMPFAERDRLIARDPDTFYLTSHYLDYPVVLVRLARVNRSMLHTLLDTGWRFVRSGARVTARASHRPRARSRR